MNVNTKSNLLFIIIGIILVSYSKVNFAQSPPLGIASTFAVFTSAGAINNSGATSVIGNIGTNVGTFTGFSTGTIVGQIHVADSVSVQAAIDTDLAYTYLNGLVCDTVIGTTLGNNQILTPNVYCLGSASTLNGDLILDGQGDPNSFFIFKIDGAFSTNSVSKIILINSTSSSNVYWQVNGLFTLGDTSFFMGTVIANGAISLLEGSSLEGRGLSRAGAISLNNNVISLTTNLSALPIGLISFNAACIHQNAVLKWSTASEANNDYYLVEHSLNGIDWATVGVVDGSGNSTTQKNYSFIDEESYNDISYYRLKQIDFDKSCVYSSIIDFENCEENLTELDIYPNPGNGELNILFNGDKEQINSISIYNSIGEKVYNSDCYQPEINLTNKEEGIYFIHYNLISETIIKKIAIKRL